MKIKEKRRLRIRSERPENPDEKKRRRGVHGALREGDNRNRRKAFRSRYRKNDDEVIFHFFKLFYFIFLVYIFSEK